MTLRNRLGNQVVLGPLGAAIVEVRVPDGTGAVSDVTVAAGGSAGKTIGRYANRIAGGRFRLDGVEYRLRTNEGKNTLHGGPDGFSKRPWELISADPSSVEFGLESSDGDQGFPGALKCSIRYTWNDENELRLAYRAATSKPTVVNFTNHVYFNLSGAASIADHELRIAASRYTPLDRALIPTGEIAPVAGTDGDFRAMRAIGDVRFDRNYVLDDWTGDLRYAATLLHKPSGRAIVVETTQPGLQLYTGKPGAVALETQHFADAPNHPEFPSTVLRPGEVFASTTVYRFVAASQLEAAE